MRSSVPDIERATLPEVGLQAERVVPDLDVSVVVLLEKGRNTAAELYREYSPPLKRLGKSFEFLFIVESGSRELSSTIFETDGADHSLRVLEVGQPVGQSAVLKLAVEHGRGRHILTLPPSFRVAADALPDLIRELEEGSDVAVARRTPRCGSWVNRFQSAFCTWLLNLGTGARFHDITCRVIAMRREVLAGIPLYGSYFRFLPIVAEREGFRVKEVGVKQHPGGGTTRLYRPGIYLGWLIDILGIFFLLRFTYRPLRFFGSVGAVFGLLGGAILMVLFVQRLGGVGIANRPMLLLGVLLVTLGVQSVALGLIGEIVVHFQAARGSTYRLARAGRTTDI